MKKRYALAFLLTALAGTALHLPTTGVFRRSWGCLRR